MGVIICEQHGEEFIEFVCEHLITATAENRPCKPVQELTIGIDVHLAGWFCLDCIEAHRLNEVQDLENVVDLFLPVCKACFEDWRKHTRQGEPS